MSTKPHDSFTEGVIWKEMLRFCIPIMLGTLLQQLYNAADAIIVGRALGTAALAAVGGSSSSIICLLVNFFVALSSGASVVLSQYYGADDREKVRRGVFTAVLLATACGLFVTLVGVFGARPLLLLLHTTADTIDASASYLRVYFLGMIPTMLYNMGSSILRAMGDSKKPLYFLFACVLANVGLDLLFVLVFHWGVIGAAAATALSQVICAVLVLRALRRLPKEFRLTLSLRELDDGLLRLMVRIGLPSGVQSAMFNIANMVLQSAINMLGTDSIAAWTAFRKIDDVFWPIGGAIGIAVMTFVGQNYGAGHMDRVRESIRRGLAIYALIAAAFSVLVVLLREPLISLFVIDDAEVIAIGSRVALMTCSFYVTFTFTEIFSAAMRGVSHAVAPAVITMLTCCVARLVYLWVYGFAHVSNEVIAAIYPISWALSSLVFLLYYKRGHWLPGAKNGSSQKVG